ncbi:MULTISPECIES: hypothetical protein [unclassified Bacillus (in: firmicutes)]|uniref:COG4705 family protein n=1 Tax=unclassified Bacillus (in: firmicutes) TaxID=185979 RepID=UPI00211D269A|nr:MULTISPECIES: hypothetical protein [unclassified Bacillus (in: firmicutes)]
METIEKKHTNKTINPQIENMLKKVPEVTIFFWITKLLTTGMGEVFSDYIVKTLTPVIGVAVALIVLILSLFLQFKVRKYIPSIYWLVVVMISVFGTVAADVVHVGLGVPYVASTLFFAVLLAIIFAVWYRKEKTLSIHSIYTKRREVLYWSVVMGTFALGTAAGDMTASTMHLGYFSSGILFTILLAIPVIGKKFFKLNEIFSFWFAYIMTRPVGASFSDWSSVSQKHGGLGFGGGPVSLVLSIIIIILVAYLSISKKDVMKVSDNEESHSTIA